MSWAYIKVFQYLCDYQEGRPSLSLFYHLFRVQQSAINRARGQCLITLAQLTRYFEAHSYGVKHFKDRFMKCAPEHGDYVRMSRNNELIILCLYIDYLIISSSCEKEIEDFKLDLMKEFEMDNLETSYISL